MAIPVIIPLALSAISTGASIIQGIEARKDLRAANRAADDALAAARKKLSINRFEGLQVPIEAYQMAEDAQVRQQQQALTALTEAGPRALAAGIGKVDLTGLQATEERRQKMAQDMFELDKLKATETAKIDTALASMDLNVLQGAQNAALAAEQQATAAFTGAAKTVAGAGMDVYKASNLYGLDDTYGKALNTALNRTGGPVNDNNLTNYSKFLQTMSENTIKSKSPEELEQDFVLSSFYQKSPGGLYASSSFAPFTQSVGGFDGPLVEDIGYQFSTPSLSSVTSQF